ncbi:MAG: pentapeptide repeat-containing protein, partial [Alphaproteobacteria bacterium]|nr:pentapeptide repeat-containing protein [Alphaproteobacteria bacterium]
MSSDEKRKRLAGLEQRWTKEKLAHDMALVRDFLSPNKKDFVANCKKKDTMIDLSFLNFQDHDIAFEQSCDFHLPISFLHSEFGSIYIHWARFQKKVNFRAAIFHKKIKFIDSTFNNIANFEFAIFHKKAEFSGIYFHDRAAFNFAIFENYVSFKGSSFHAFLIDEAYFSILPNFRYTLFDKQIRFHSVHIPAPRASINHDERKEKSSHSSRADKRRRDKSYEDKYRTLKEMASATNDHTHEHEFYGYELESKWLFKEFRGRWLVAVGLPLLLLFLYKVDKNFWPLIVIPLFFATITYLPVIIITEKFLRHYAKIIAHHNDTMPSIVRHDGVKIGGHLKIIEQDFANIIYIYLLRVYWLFSYYGQSLARPFAGFTLLPFIFAFSYWRPEKNVSFDEALHFSTLNMIPGNSLFRFNHLEYLKEKIFGISNPENITAFQSLTVTYPKEITFLYDALLHTQEFLSLFFIFLIGLAIRNKFRIV